MPRDKMAFVPLHFGNKLEIINPKGSVGVIILWSTWKFIKKKFRSAGIDLNSKTSHIAAVGNLYGNGIPHLLRNLLYNPQITDLIICGLDKSDSQKELIAFFDNGLEEKISLGQPTTYIKGTSRAIDNLIKPEQFLIKPRVISLGDLRSDESIQYLKDFFTSYNPSESTIKERIKVPLPEIKVSYFPSEPRDHNIVRDRPLEAWRELIFRLVRFGHLVTLPKGERQELQNVKIVIRLPQLDNEADLNDFGWSLKRLKEYQQDMLQVPLFEDQSYTYGNRIRQYYGFDALKKFGERLKENPEDRDCYLALWDSHLDIDADDAPCLVSLFFRTYDEKLTLTACYRAHNALDAWLKNVYGLIKVQEIVASGAGIEAGSLIVISHSISIDPVKYDTALKIAKTKGFELLEDPNGQVRISVDNKKRNIVVEHISNNGQLIGRYCSSKAELIQHCLYRDSVVADINHAMYVGRQLNKAEMCLTEGWEFKEE